VGVRDLVDQDVVAVIGPVSSGEAEAVFAQAPELEVPVATGTANKDGITEEGQGWAFRNTASNSQLYGTVMPIFQEHFGVQRVALIYDEASPGPAGAADVMTAVANELNIEIVDTATFTTLETDFASIVQQVKSMDVDGLFVSSLPTEGGLLAAELNRQGVDLPVLGFPAQNSGKFREGAGPDLQDWMVPGIFYPPAQGEKAQQFWAAITDADEQPPTVPEAVNHYDLLHMIAQVAGEAGINGSTDPAVARTEIRDGLAGLRDFDGAAGSIDFEPNGDTTREVFALLLSGTEGTENITS
jgi:branched-chain amino acid transport system substrate-binding protein